MADKKERKNLQPIIAWQIHIEDDFILTPPYPTISASCSRNDFETGSIHYLSQP